MKRIAGLKLKSLLHWWKPRTKAVIAPFPCWPEVVCELEVQEVQRPNL